MASSPELACRQGAAELDLFAPTCPACCWSQVQADCTDRAKAFVLLFCARACRWLSAAKG